MNKIALSMLAMLLAACTSAPKPPVVDGSNRQPINTGQTIHQPAIPKKTTPIEDKQYGQPIIPQPIKSENKRTPTPVNNSQIVTVQYPFKATRFRPSADQSEEIRELIQTSNRIVIRGRTDSNRHTATDEAIALKRALSAKRYMLKHGASPLMICINYLSGGDYLSENTTSSGRHKNRRVELEFFN